MEATNFDGFIYPIIFCLMQKGPLFFCRATSSKKFPAAKATMISGSKSFRPPRNAFTEVSLSSPLLLLLQLFRQYFNS
ncbi:3155_t:CDS:2 [Ambispora leptoticha]|uniref:3155_t:CDS:1 n=1 Tax=Ambispora leptoticha TaxID=144679 RepID=A0A9N8Z3C0_9GLOM|nr:3155_t:CDS:2 [Ambispora leptoticha]